MWGGGSSFLFCSHHSAPDMPPILSPSTVSPLGALETLPPCKPLESHLYRARILPATSSFPHVLPKTRPSEPQPPCPLGSLEQGPNLSCAAPGKWLLSRGLYIPTYKEEEASHNGPKALDTVTGFRGCGRRQPAAAPVPAAASPLRRQAHIGPGRGTVLRPLPPPSHSHCCLP